MKHLKLFENFKNYEYPINISNIEQFKNILNKYIQPFQYKIENNIIHSDSDISDIIKASLHIYNILNKNNIIIEKYEDIFKYTSEQLVDYFGYEGFNHKDDAIEHLDYLFQNKYPYGYLKVPEKLLLYRVIFTKSINDIDTEELGYHFIPNKNLIDFSFLQSIGAEEYDWDETPPYLVEVILDINHVDWKNTIATNLSFPNEYEIMSKTKNKYLKIKNISKLDI